MVTKEKKLPIKGKKRRPSKKAELQSTLNSINDYIKEVTTTVFDPLFREYKNKDAKKVNYTEKITGGVNMRLLKERISSKKPYRKLSKEKVEALLIKCFKASSDLTYEISKEVKLRDSKNDAVRRKQYEMACKYRAREVKQQEVVKKHIDTLYQLNLKLYGL